MTPSGENSGVYDHEAAGLRVIAGKEDLLQQIEHLRRTVAYDYPPGSVHHMVRQVRRAARGYGEAWGARSVLERAEASEKGRAGVD